MPETIHNQKAIKQMKAFLEMEAAFAQSIHEPPEQDLPGQELLAKPAMHEAQVVEQEVEKPAESIIEAVNVDDDAEPLQEEQPSHLKMPTKKKKKKKKKKKDSAVDMKQDLDDFIGGLRKIEELPDEATVEDQLGSQA